MGARASRQSAGERVRIHRAVTGAVDNWRGYFSKPALCAADSIPS